MTIKFLLFSAFIFTSFFLNAEIDISLTPSPIIAGEPSYLSIKSSEGPAEIVDIPDVKGVQWLNKARNGSNVMIINGERFDITQYGFVVDKPGKFSFPTFKIKYGGEEIETQPREFTARSGALSDIDTLIFIEPKFNVKGKVYVGQSVQLDIYLLSAQDIEAKPTSYPQIMLDNVMYDNYSSKNSENERFAAYPYYPPERIEREGAVFLKTCFMTSFRPMVPGKLKGSVSLPLDIVVPNNSSARRNMIDSRLFNSSIFDDPFFSRDKHVAKNISASIPNLDVLPLPKQPDNVNFLGLFGKWDVGITVTPEKLSEGETLTIKIEISGYGSLETLKAPDLTIPDFTSYKPEISKDQAIDLSGSKSKAVITYILVPKEAGKTKISLLFATFNTQEDKYEIYKSEKDIEVTKNNHIQSQSINSARMNQIANSSQSVKKKENDSILYIKKNVSCELKVPLWKNYMPFYIAFIVLGPLLLVISELLRKKKNSITENSLRKQKALKRKGRILRELKTKNGLDFSNFIDSDVVPFINDVSGFPPGTTSYELTSKLSDKTFSECLHEANKTKYMSGMDSSSEKDLKIRLSRCLRKICFIMFGFFIFSYSAQALPIDDFTLEYNRGNFKQAEEICHANLNSETPSPDWLYNLGNTCVQEGKLADALVYYKRALLLDPRDQDILQNLNYVRRLLYLPELYQTKTPLELLTYLRDMLRPDEWLLMASIMFFALFIVIAFRRKISYYSFISASLILLSLIIIGIGVSINQTSALYSSKNAIITIRNPIIHSLPTDDSAEVKMLLSIGDEVKVQDKMDGWSLISSKNNKTIGWVTNNTAAQIWPY